MPKRRNLWLFGAWGGDKFADNPKYIYLRLVSEPAGIEAVWVAKNRKLVRKLGQQGLPAVYAYSLKGAWLQARAGAVIFSHACEWEFAAWLVGRGSFRVQTWHGVPLKKIGYDDRRSGLSRQWVRFRTALLWYTTKRLDLVLAAGDEERTHLASAFDVSPDVVKITGYPRNDVLFRRDVHSSEPHVFRAIYMPTLRGRAGSAFDLLHGGGLDYRRYDGLLDAAGISLDIKLHPVQRFQPQDLEYMDNCRSIKPVQIDGDIYEALANYDLLITDFSGVLVDWVVTQKPLILAPMDLGDYLAKDRNLYYDYSEFTISPHCTNWLQIISTLIEFAKVPPEARDSYRKFQRRFHRYLDGGSVERVIREIALVAGTDVW